MTTLTPERRAELKRLCEQATPGPWEVTDESCARCRKENTHEYAIYAIPQGNHDQFIRKEDADFIAAARTALPSLLEEVERLERERDRHAEHARSLAAAAESAESALRAQQQWISVDEKLPEYGQRILCCGDFSGDVWVDTFMGEFVTEETPDDGKQTKFWQLPPLPQAPAETGEEK